MTSLIGIIDNSFEEQDVVLCLGKLVIQIILWAIGTHENRYKDERETHDNFSNWNKDSFQE